MVKIFKTPKTHKVYDTSSKWGLFKTYMAFLWGDHAYLRLGFTNAHWIDDQMLRANQPWPFQLKWFQKHDGIKTVINLRGQRGSFYALEKYACARLGLKLVDFKVTSRDVPTKEAILAAKEMFERIEYPALLHCKSGADRAGIMSVLYRHLHLGHPIEDAMSELGLRTLHMKAGKTGVLDYIFERYLTVGKPQGLSFVEWTQSEDYDPVRIKSDFKGSWWGTLLTEKIFRRE
ncbi:tyrosine-protein phosphatase [Asticcacaulis sp. ZE23SCel15]|uniref:fused DSP-PTPase phosphatase/NAD kinase-like protein n=1 Tax=Asticcacaulis sp. ZE23SCel15 TaxID=3059027 RepID=UPI002660072C|nr:tyrosine-protein phosphatase [Asticcacaulis sp. ZE23SCel15]WKL57000.1 tyrosine-protein phosphatase [Asticcacaulis sp. ZE23SCel15]